MDRQQKRKQRHEQKRKAKRERKRGYILKPDGSKGIPLNDQMMALLKRQREQFKAVYGREPGPNDPVFFGEVPDPEQTCDLLRKTTGREDMIHVFRKTGRIMTEDSAQFLTDEELDEVEEFTAEAHELHDDGSECHCPINYHYFGIAVGTVGGGKSGTPSAEMM